MVSRVNNFNWDKIIKKMDFADAQRSLQLLRGKANEIEAFHAKYGKAPLPIDFAAYKKKLNFTASAVGSLEDLYKKKKLPTFSATLPAFEAKKRALMLQTAADLVNATKADLKDLYVQLENFEKERFTKHTTVGQTMQRFPKIAKEVEQELKEHKYLVDAV